MFLESKRSCIRVVFVLLGESLGDFFGLNVFLGEAFGEFFGLFPWNPLIVLLPLSSREDFKELEIVDLFP